MALSEKTLVCRDCGKEFTFTVGEQEFYLSHGLQNDPSRCPECRVTRRKSRQSGDPTQPRKMFNVVCAECGAETTVPFEPRGDRPVYCRDCFSKRQGATTV
jgi:CxxC-x17-CxxC domain-containing protein